MLYPWHPCKAQSDVSVFGFKFSVAGVCTLYSSATASQPRSERVFSRSSAGQSRSASEC